MKTFIYTIKSTKSTSNGGRKQVADVYQINRNRPRFAGTVTWDTAGYHGAIHEIGQHLVCEKLIPASWMKDGYLQDSKANKKRIDIYEI